MELSDFILNIGKEIEEKSGLYVNFANGSTKPVEEWISEDQISQMKSITLRMAKESKNEEDMKLPQFNPSFKLKERAGIRCRVPECKVTKPALPTDSSEKNKQDLFLCDEHRKVLINLVLERCANENIVVNIANYTHKDFKGYTNLIGLLDKAFRHVRKKPSRSSTDSILAEVFLNTRNFLFLTNALLNPNGDNEVPVLTPFLIVFLTILQNLLENPEQVQNLLATLQGVADIVLYFFGILYSWVLVVDPGSRLGAGVGLCLGFLGSAWYACSYAGILATSLVGLFVGKLIGSGSYDWKRDTYDVQHQQNIMMKYQEFVVKQFGRRASTNPLFRVDANADGDLAINIEQNE